jgi:hypothetical protein
MGGIGEMGGKIGEKMRAKMKTRPERKVAKARRLFLKHAVFR